MHCSSSRLTNGTFRLHMGPLQQQSKIVNLQAVDRTFQTSEQVSVDYSKAKTTVITYGQSQQKTAQSTYKNLEQIHVTGINHRKKSASKVTIGFVFASHWLRKWCELC